MGALAAGGVLMVQTLHSLPRLQGALQLPGLSAAVQVQRDASDVTHIEGASAPDVWRALGFVHAQERGWQLEFNRRLMRGELSEILGPATLDTDKLMRTLGIVQAARVQLQGLSEPTRAALQAYSDGIVQAHAVGAAGRSPEFRLLGVRAGGAQGQPWTPEDSVAWALMMALDLGGNWGNEFARFSAAQVLSTEQLWQLMPPYPGEKPASGVDLAALYAQLGAHAQPEAKRASQAIAQPPQQTALLQWSQDWVRDMGTLDGKGSNNWVVPGSRTVHGRPLLANDPHLALSAPAIWYFAHLKAPAGTLAGQAHPALNVVGATLPGTPFVVLGRTAGVAWGFTNTGPDVQDLYLEAIDPKQASHYRLPQGSAAFETRPERILVKGQAPVEITVRRSRHGPVVSDVQPQYQRVLNTERYAMALRWSALEPDNRTLDAALQANWAQTVAQLQDAYALHHSPMQSVVMADTQGQVGFKAVGKVPLRQPGNDLKGVAPAPGWLAQYDWSGWLPYAQNPTLSHAQIERQGGHATANQNILPAAYPHFIGSDWTTPERYERIQQLLSATDKHDADSMARIQNDVLSLGAQALLPHALQAQPRHPLGPQALDLLRKFDGHMGVDTVAGLILNVWAHELTVDLLSGPLGRERFQGLYGKRHFRAAVLGILQRQDAFWCGPAACPAAVSGAMDKALARLQAQLGSDPAQWRWGRLHPAISSHKPFGKVPVLRRLFDERVDSAGDLFTVNVGQYWANDPQEPFANRHAASLRAIYDLSDVQRSRFIYQTGQSGHPASPRSRNMAPLWASGQYLPLQMQANPILHHLVLQP
jgi:penicillin amidase